MVINDSPAFGQRKVLLLCHSYGLNGACIMLLQLARFWVRQLGWSVQALVHPALAQSDGIYLERAGVGLAFEVRPQDGFDFCLINTVLDIGHAERVSKLMPVAAWVHESTTAVSNMNMPITQLYRLFLHCRKLVFQTRWQSEHVFGTFTHALAAGRVAVVPNGIPDMPQISARKPHDGAMLDVVFLGSIYGRKRPGDLAKAVALLAQQHPVRCTFIGDTHHMNTLAADEAQLMRTHPAITLAGPMERNAALQRVAQADVLVLSSADESQPLVPLEAAALKVPVVLSRLPMYPYSGWADGENCLMHEPGDVAGLAGALLKLHQDPGLRQRLGQAGHALSEQFALPLFLQRMTAELVAM